MGKEIKISKGTLRLEKKIYSSLLLSSVIYTFGGTMYLINDPNPFSGLAFTAGVVSTSINSYLLVKTKKKL